MTAPIYFRLFAAALLVAWTPFTSGATGKVIAPTYSTHSYFQENKQEKKEPKKPVKEVPQSRKQEKPREVKPDSKPQKR